MRNVSYIKMIRSASIFVCVTFKSAVG